MYTLATPSASHLTLGLSQESVLQRICVKPPYYALNNESYYAGVFRAEASAELAQGSALGPMRPGDISRHGAIAGSCAIALAQSDDEPRYYLATKASYCGMLLEAPYGTPVQFEAKVEQLNKRRAEATIYASVDGRLLATLNTTYSILKPALFDRLNAHRRALTVRSGAMNPIGEYPTRWTGDTGVCTVPSLPASACSGHFDNYPAAPVALLMHQLAQVAEDALPHPSYIARAEVTADSLCWAGEEAVFSMTKMTKVGDELGESRFDGGISSEGKSVGTMQLWLRY